MIMVIFVTFRRDALLYNEGGPQHQQPIRERTKRSADK